MVSSLLLGMVMTSTSMQGPAPAGTPVTSTSTAATTSPPPVVPPATVASEPVVSGPSVPVLAYAPRVRRFGLHLGINATLTFDFSIGRWLYGGVTSQLTGLAILGDINRNVVVSALGFFGVGIPLSERGGTRVTLDVAPMVSYFHASPVNMFNVGLLAGIRVVHSSGFTFAFKLPLIGYAGAPDALRDGLLYYYTGAIITVPVITLGYTF